MRKRDMAVIGALMLAACEPPTGASSPDPGPVPRLAKGGNGGGGGGPGGGGGGNPGGGGATPVVVLRPTTSAGLPNAFQGDGRDVGGEPRGDGESWYSDGSCGITSVLELHETGDTLRLNLHISTSLKRKDPCEGGPRAVTLEFPPNPIFASFESLGNFQWKWEPDGAPSNGDDTPGLGKINIQNQPPACSPLRYNPLRDDGKFAASDFIRVERIEGGWRLFTAPDPENVGQCEDRSSSGPNDPTQAGAAIPLDFEVLVDDDAGDGIGPAN